MQDAAITTPRGPRIVAATYNFQTLSQVQNVSFSMIFFLLLSKKFCNIIGGTKKNFIYLIDANGAVVPPSKSCFLLNDTFKKVFLLCQPHAQSYHCSTATFTPMDPIVVDWTGITPLVANLKLSSSSGVDGINSKFLKNADVYCSITLAEMFTQFFSITWRLDNWQSGPIL